MITVPAAFLNAANKTHAPRWRASILDKTGAPLVSDLPVVRGEINSDMDQTTAAVDVPTQESPQKIDQRYLPTGGRLKLEYTIEHLGTWVTVADLDMTASAISRPDSLWTIAASDQSGRIDLDDLARGAPVGSPANIGAAITALAQRTLPGLTVTITGTAATMPVPAGLIRPTGSPWRTIRDLAATAGSYARFTAARTLAVRPVPDFAGTPVDTLGVGDGGVLTAYFINHEMAYNSVALVYEDNLGAVLRTGRWTDTRADSPVAVARIGTEVVWRQSREATAAPTQADADAAAAAIGRRVGGKARAPQLRHPVRPWLEPGDTVTVAYLGGQSEPQIVDS